MPINFDDLLTKNEDYSHQNQPNIPLYIKIDSLHGIPLDLKNRKAKIKIILKKCSSNKPLFIKIKEFQEKIKKFFVIKDQFQYNSYF